MAMLTRGISFRRQGSSGMSWADNWTFTDAGMFRIPKASDHIEPPEKAAAAMPPKTPQKLPHTTTTTTNLVVDQPSSGVVGPATEPTVRVQKITTSSKQLHRRHSSSSSMWGIRWIKNRFKKSKGKTERSSHSLGGERKQHSEYKHFDGVTGLKEYASTM